MTIPAVPLPKHGTVRPTIDFTLKAWRPVEEADVTPQVSLPHAF